MNPDFQRLVRDATRLTRGGNLQAATAAIQAALRGAGAHPEAAAAGAGIVDALDVLAVSSTRVPAAAGSFIAGHAHGRDYKLYIPASAGTRALPLVVMLHGCTQDPDDFAAGTRMNELAHEADCFVLYPAQAVRANPQRCWNWFKHSHQARGRGEPAMLSAITRDVVGAHGIDATRVYVAGLSAGGAMAAILGDAYPDLFAAVGVHSGLATGAARDLPSALAAMKGGGSGPAAAVPGRPTIVFHGDKDGTVHLANGAAVIDASTRGAATSGEREPGRTGAGRGFTRYLHRRADGRVHAEHWVVHGAGHAWSGGSRSGSYTDPAGPDASAEMLRFFFAQEQPASA